MARTGQKPTNTEDRQGYYAYGNSREIAFVAMMQAAGYNAIINPEKHKDPTVPDLVVMGKLADLKAQETHFFMAEKMYGIKSEKAVFLNGKDYARYMRRYPDLDLYFWVSKDEAVWKSRGGKTYSCGPVHGVWMASMKTISQLVEAGAQKHYYQKRASTRDGQAKFSYILNLEDMFFVI